MDYPRSMNAVVMDKPGGADGLRMALIDAPRPAADQVLVKVAYAGVNPADWKAREGSLRVYFEYTYPFVLGFDATGTIVATGAAVQDLEVGDRVVLASNFGRGERGAYAEYVAADSARAVRLPDHVSLKDAATLPTAGMTACQAIFDVGALQSGQKVLVNGGSGGVGSFAIQLAKRTGARVAATCSAKNLDYVRALGAELAIDYQRHSARAAIADWAPAGVDLLVDTIGPASLADAVAMIRSGGLLAMIGNSADPEAVHDVAAAETRDVAVRKVITTFAAQPAQLRELVKALADGDIAAPEVTVMPLDQAAAAHRLSETGHVRGKILLSVSPGS